MLNQPIQIEIDHNYITIELWFNEPIIKYMKWAIHALKYGNISGENTIVSNLLKKGVNI